MTLFFIYTIFDKYFNESQTKSYIQYNSKTTTCFYIFMCVLECFCPTTRDDRKLQQCIQSIYEHENQHRQTISIERIEQ